ncbi:MAG: alpha-glucan family phosphorylase [Anaerolineales bacterium]|jgi:starch phosphorylase
MRPNTQEDSAPPGLADLSLPSRLDRLPDLAYNLWWTWHPQAQRLFSRIDNLLWEHVHHNPVRFLRKVHRPQLNAMSYDRFYLDLYDRVMAEFDEYLTTKETWYASHHPELTNNLVAYISTEYGFHESLPMYAGGLGVLSGDHLKEASDLGMPVVGVGFLYTRGYFRQRVSEDGWQEAMHETMDFASLPVWPVLDQHQSPVVVSVPLPGRDLSARLWRVCVGRCSLFLLDSNVEANSPEDRELTARLYTSELENRISQEIILGIGGVRALRALGRDPAAWHLNEGHSAFALLERCREDVVAGRGFAEAAEIVRASSVFTTHTPVAAGSDEFPLWLMDKFFAPYWPQLGLERDAFLDLGRRQQSWGEVFSMPVLAMRLSGHINAVSELHGIVSRRMWHFLWPNLTEENVPIHHITNGVHIETWLARRMGILFGKYLGADWRRRIDDPEMWESVSKIPEAELWSVRSHLKRKLVAHIRERTREMWLAGGMHPVQAVAEGALLDPYTLTIGFARRFTTYKRPALILSDPDRLLRLINQPNMPVQIIFAGKAHPADEPAKRMLQEVYRVAKRAEVGGRVVFLEDYDIELSRYLVQGVDVWLNTPRRLQEASGTSGQKAALNGVLNFSVLDGWWREAYNGQNGWAIGEDLGANGDPPDPARELQGMYETLENEIVPLYYRRSAEDVPSEWVARIKESIRTLSPQFCTRRMLKEYASEMYLPALTQAGSAPRDTSFSEP